MKHHTRITALLLGASLLFSGLSATLPAAAETSNTSQGSAFEVLAPQAAPDLTASETAALSPATLLSYLLEQPLTHEEKVWLESEGAVSLPSTLSLTYDSTIPHAAVSVTFDPQGVPTVTAKPYTGVTKGTVWTPVTVLCGDVLFPLSIGEDGQYTAKLNGITDALVTVTVQYEAVLTFASEDLQVLQNAAYHRGQEILSAKQSYEAAARAHAEATAVYREAMKQYRAELSLYQAYETEKKQYDARLVAYEAYLAAMETYKARLTAYEAYLAEKAVYDKAYAEYTDFIQNPSAYEKKYLAYHAYLTNMEKVRLQLTYMDSCFIGDSQGNVLHGTLNGPTVATVVARQDELVAVGCDAQDIANADSATATLIHLLNGYPTEGDDPQRYAYYIRHYAEFRDNVTLLYTSLSRLYTNDTVPDILQMQGKKERYWQFVAQLYALSCALEDGVSFDRSWSIAEGKLTELLDDCFILTDANTAAPLTAYPTAVDPVTPPSDVKKPTEPSVVSRPYEPAKVEKPTPPAEVVKPTLPQSPGAAPVEPLFSAAEDALAQAVKNHTLTLRQASLRAIPYTVSLAVGTSAANGETPVACFYNADGMTLLFSVLADSEGKVSMPTETPSRPSQSGYAYTFSGWINDQGQVYGQETDHAVIQQNTCFYAVYASEKEHFTVTWDVDGTLIQETCAFGEIPVFDGTPQKAADEANVYEFIGWSPAVTPVSDHITYTAVFAAFPRVYTITWQVGDEVTSDTYDAGELPAYAGLPGLPMDGRYRYVFQGWTPEITPAAEDQTYMAVFEAVDLTEGVDGITVSEDEHGVTVSRNDGDAWRFPTKHLLAYAAEKHSPLTFAQGSFSLTFGTESVLTLASLQAEQMTLDITNQHGLVIRLLNQGGQEILECAHVQVRLTATLPTGYAARLTDENGHILSATSTEESTLIADLSPLTAYRFEQGYPIQTQLTVEGQAGDVGGLCLPQSDLAQAGNTVTLTVTPAPGYGIHAVIVRDHWGAVLPSSDSGNGHFTFTMPEGNVTVTADFVQLEYTVSFMSGGHLIASGIYRYGDTPTVPPAPIRESDGTYSYTFTGWSPTVTAVMGDAVYEASFLAVPLGSVDSVEESVMGLLQLFLLGFGVFAVTCAGILVPYLIVSKKKSVTAEVETEITESEN